MADTTTNGHPNDLQKFARAALARPDLQKSVKQLILSGRGGRIEVMYWRYLGLGDSLPSEMGWIYRFLSSPQYIENLAHRIKAGRAKHMVGRPFSVSENFLEAITHLPIRYRIVDGENLGGRQARRGPTSSRGPAPRPDTEGRVHIEDVTEGKH